MNNSKLRQPPTQFFRQKPRAKYYSIDLRLAFDHSNNRVVLRGKSHPGTYAPGQTATLRITPPFAGRASIAILTDRLVALVDALAKEA